MPFEYKIVETEKLVLVTANGPIDFALALELGDAIPRDPAFQREYSVLVDLREMNFDPDVEALRDFAERLHRFKQEYRGRIALVTKPDFIYQLALFAAAVAEERGFPMKAFPSVEEARSWVAGSA